MNSLLNNKKVRLLGTCLLLAATVYFAVGNPRWWFYSKNFFLNRPAPTSNGDDVTYYYIAEHFWGLTHDPSFVKIKGPYAELLNVYPVRGIGLGTIVLPFHRLLGEGWKSTYTRFIIAINVIGVLTLAFGLAAYTGRILFMAPFFAFLVDKFSLCISDESSYCTEAVSRALVPFLVGIIFLLANAPLGRLTFIALSSALVLTGLTLCLMKVQWVMGIFLMGAVLLLSKTTRKSGYIVLATAIVSIAALRGINYFSFSHNKELFAANGLHALPSPEGRQIVLIGCRDHRFPSSLEPELCKDIPEDANKLWWPLLLSKAPATDKARFLEVCSNINLELTSSNIPARLHRLAKNSTQILKDMYFTMEIPTAIKTIKLGILGILFLAGLVLSNRGKTVQILSVTAFLYGAVFLSSLTTIYWEYRFAVPVRSFFYVLPILVILDSLIQKKDALWTTLQKYYVSISGLWSKTPADKTPG